MHSIFQLTDLSFQAIDPELAKMAFDRLMQKEGIEVLLHATVINASRHNNRITSVTVHQRSGPLAITAAAFVDASGECDLAFFGGASVRTGSEGRQNLGSLSTRLTGFAPGTVPTNQSWSTAIKKAKSENSELQLDVRKSWGVVLKIPGSEDVITFLPSAVYDPCNAESISVAERSGRKQAIMCKSQFSKYIPLVSMLSSFQQIAISFENFLVTRTYVSYRPVLTLEQGKADI